MKVVTILNPKGGVAKTETAVFLAYELAERGYKVITIDLDPMTYMFERLYVQEGTKYNEETQDIVIDMEEKDIKKAIYPVNDNLDIAFSLYHFNDLRMENDSSEIVEKTKKLFSFLNNYKYDYCIIDLKHSYSETMGCILSVTNEIIIPTELDCDSIEGIRNILEAIELIKTNEKIIYYNPDILINGVLITRWNEDIDGDEKLVARLKGYVAEAKTKIFRAKIRNSLYIKRAKVEKVFLKQFAPEAPVTKDYLDFVDEYLQLYEENLDISSREEQGTERKANSSNNKSVKSYIRCDLTLKQKMAIDALAVRYGRYKAYIINRLIERGLKINFSEGIDFEFSGLDKVSQSCVKLIPVEVKQQIKAISEKLNRSMTYVVSRLIDVALNDISM